MAIIDSKRKGDEMIILIILIASIAVFGLLIMYSALAIPKSEIDRLRDDEEQMEYLRKLR